MELTSQQILLRDLPFDKKIFVRGEAGTGKSTAAIAHLEQMISKGIPSESILVLVPQRPLARPYMQALSNPNLPAGTRPSILTIGGLARRMDELFWPLLRETAGFRNPEMEPQFLTVESTQYFLSLIVDPLREKGYFDGISIEPLRLYSQILDNLNKTAVVGFPINEIAPRLRSAWIGSQADTRYFDQAQECAYLFRDYCLEHCLLDFSLQLDVFYHHLWQNDIFQKYLKENYQYLIYDNVEEDYPIAHTIVREWIPRLRGTLLILDENGGYRSFLGADPLSAATLADMTEKTIRLTEPINVPPSLIDFRHQLAGHIRMEPVPPSAKPLRVENVNLHYCRFFPQMLDSVVNCIENLTRAGTNPGDIAVLSPFVSDSLRFSLQTRLEEKNIKLTTHRPGRELRNEPAVRCLFAMAKLAHPQWKLKIKSLEWRNALMTAIEGLDLIRADFLANTLLSHKTEGDVLNPFSQLKPEMAERITYQVGEKYEIIRAWLAASHDNTMQDLPAFFTRCFGELLSQKGFGFHQSYDMADATERLIQSAREFDSVIRPVLPQENSGAEFLQLLENGITGAQFLPSWLDERKDAVLLSPAFTFLIRNQPCPYQIWLDPGNTGWWERLNQPLTHPVVLSLNWPPDARWTDAEELNHNQNSLVSHTGGLLNRCTDSLHIFLIQVDEQGNEPRGPLLQAINRFLRYNPGGLTLYDA